MMMTMIIMLSSLLVVLLFYCNMYAASLEDEIKTMTIIKSKDLYTKYKS